MLAAPGGPFEVDEAIPGARRRMQPAGGVFSVFGRAAGYSLALLVSRPPRRSAIVRGHRDCFFKKATARSMSERIEPTK